MWYALIYGKNINYPVFLKIKVIQNACCYPTWEAMEQRLKFVSRHITMSEGFTRDKTREHMRIRISMSDRPKMKSSNE